MRNRVKRMAITLTNIGKTIREKAGLFDPFRRTSTATHGSLVGGSAGRGINSLSASDRFGFDSFLGEVGKFNPLYVEPFIQVLMRRSVMPRLGLIILSAALTERQYVVEGADPEVEKFHQDWIDELLPSILEGAPLAVWYGWQPFILDWTVTEEGMFHPVKAHDLDPFAAEVIEHEITKEFAGLQVDGQTFDRTRAFKLTWEGHHGNHYGEAQALTVYSYWWSWSILLCLTLKYYERSVDPVRMAMAQNVSVATGAVVGGEPEFIDLTELVAEALDVVGGGDSVALPIGTDGEKLVDVTTLDLPDRSDTYLKMLAYLEEKQLLATMSLPGIGVGSSYGDVSGQDARISEKTQLRVLEYVSNMPVAPLNELIAQVHRANRLPGKPPKLKGKAFKREQQEMLLDLFKTAMLQPHPEIGPDGEPTGRAYRPSDLIKFDKVAKQMDLPINDIMEVARAPEDLLDQAPGQGGRPREELNDPDTPSGRDVSRAEARESGRKR